MESGGILKSKILWRKERLDIHEKRSYKNILKDLGFSCKSSVWNTYLKLKNNKIGIDN